VRRNILSFPAGFHPGKGSSRALVQGPGKGGMIKASGQAATRWFIPRTAQVIAALKKLELLVVVDFSERRRRYRRLHPAPASWLERKRLPIPELSEFHCGRQKVIDPWGVPDEYEVLFDLLNRMGVALPFPEPVRTPRDLYNLRLKKSGLTFEELKNGHCLGASCRQKIREGNASLRRQTGV